MNEEYILTKIGRGKKTMWVCRTDGHKASGAGSRPDLAIRDYKTQRRRWDSHDLTLSEQRQGMTGFELLAEQAAIRTLNALAEAEQDGEPFDFTLQ